MQIRNAVGSLLTRLGEDRRGATSMIFTLAAVPLLGFVGLAIDYGSASRLSTRLKNTVDAAVLAGMSDMMQNADPTATINQFVATKFDGTGYTPTVAVTVDSGQGTVSASASFNMPTLFTRILGATSLPVTAMSKAAAGTGGGAFEVAIAFDTTGSMSATAGAYGGTKLSAAQAAANELITKLFTVPGSSAPNPNVKVGLVPFSDYVNVGMQYRNASWLGNANDYSTPNSGCWDTYPNATYTNPVPRSGTCYKDGVPYTCTWTDYTVNYGAPVQVCSSWTDNYVWTGCVGSQDASHDAMDKATVTYKVPPMFNTTCPAPLIRLTNDPVALKAAVDGMTADGETYIAPGLLWGWRLLSPDAQAPFGDGIAYGQAQKIMILLTDGANTHSANYGTGDHEGTDVSAANAKVLETCQNIKGTGIQLFTIAFNVTDTTIQDVLSQCSSGPPFYYNAYTVSDLQGAFAKIGGQLAGIRLVQ